MTTATVPPTNPSAMPTLSHLINYVQPGHRLLLTGVQFDDYATLVEWRDQHRPSVRLAFDSGSMEIMVTSNLHERLKKILAQLLEAWLEESGIEFVPSGELTHKRSAEERGFEPDECYYIQNWSRVIGFRAIDFATDPPPDLAVEIEVTQSVMGRLPIYAAFRVPEVWRYDGTTLRILLLQSDGTYQEAKASRAVPSMAWPDFLSFLQLPATMGNATVGRQFRAWARTGPAPAPLP